MSNLNKYVVKCSQIDNLVLQTLCGFSSLDFHLSLKENLFCPFINEILLSKDILIFRLLQLSVEWSDSTCVQFISVWKGYAFLISSNSQRKHIPEYVRNELCFQNTASSTCVWSEIVTLALGLLVANQSMWLVISPYSHELACCLTLMSDICRLVNFVLLTLVLTIFNSDLVLARVPQRYGTIGYMCMCPKKWWGDNIQFLLWG